MKRYCFILMPFGRKTDETGRIVEFDDVYERIIAPAVEDADLDPVRADEEMVGGLIHKPMFERLMMCDFAVADLTTANANVFYELGIRHGVRPHSTVLIAASGMRLPFDVAPLRAIMYELSKKGRPADSEQPKKELAERLRACRDPVDDSPLYQLITDLPRPDIDRLKTDTFRNMVEYAKDLKQRLARAREEGVEAVAAVEDDLNIVDEDPAIVVDLMLSYRAVEAWPEMVALVEKMSAPLKGTILVREQLGLALNRLGRRDEAEEVLSEVIADHGPSSETNGILGRVYKDRWQEALESGSPAAPGFLEKAIGTYLEGFEADWRDAYPGVNAVTLMEMTEPVDPRQEDLIPVVRYAAQRRCEDMTPDYWDCATIVELAVLSRDPDRAGRELARALASVRESWEPKSTAGNLRLIRERRAQRGEDVEWIKRIEAALVRGVERN